MEAIAGAIVLVAILALLSRLRPGLFHTAGQTASFLGGTQARLDWPLNYWNALAALTVLGLPLLLSLATSARSLRAQAAAAAGLPILALCAYLTFSRGGELACAVTLIVFMALAPERAPKLATALTGAAGSAVLIAGAVHRSAIEQGLAGAHARSQGNSLMITIVLVCAGVALAQGGIGLAIRHAEPPRWLVISRPTARRLLTAGVAVVLVALALLVASGTVSHEWQQFKDSRSAQLGTDRPGASASPAATAATTSGKPRSTPPHDTCWRGRVPGLSSFSGFRERRFPATPRTPTRCTSRHWPRRASSGLSCCWGSWCWSWEPPYDGWSAAATRPGPAPPGRRLRWWRSWCRPVLTGSGRCRFSRWSSCCSLRRCWHRQCVPGPRTSRRRRRFRHP